MKETSKRLNKGLVLMLCLFLIAIAAAVVGAGVPFFSQLDPRWADDYMGSSGCKIKDCGCAVVDIAMLLKYYGVDTDPKQLNTWLSNNNGYDASGAIYWNKPAEYSNGKMQYMSSLSWTSSNIATDNDHWSELYDQVIQGYPIIVKVDAYISTPQLESHWVLVTSFAGGDMNNPANYYINDPWDTTLDPNKRLSHYYDPVYDNTFFATRVCHGSSYSSGFPSTIRVYRTSLDRVDVVDFKLYTRRVLPNEWIASWPAESLKAGAVTVKTYAWYWIEQGGRYPNADVRDDAYDQVYKETTDYRTDSSIDATYFVGMKKDGEIFQSQYWDGRGKVTATTLNIRDSPGTIGTNVIGKADYGASICILSNGLIYKDEFHWFYIINTSCDNLNYDYSRYIKGWVAGEYVGSYWTGETIVNFKTRMTQWGTKYWADQGKDFRWILSYFYPNIEFFDIISDNPPTCSIQLREKNTTNPISQTNVNEWFDIYVGDSRDDKGIAEVRFSSDESQDNIPQGSWTSWYGWGSSASDWTGIWDAIRKVKTWSFATAGVKEVLAEVKDSAGQARQCSANIYARSGCVCSEWQNYGCGLGGCLQTEMYQTRTCTPTGCDIETRCIYDSSCATPSEWKSPTANGERYREFTNPENAYAHDSVYTTFTCGGINVHYHDYYNFGFNVPEGSIITKIDVKTIGLTNIVDYSNFQGGIASRDGGSNWIYARRATLWYEGGESHSVDTFYGKYGGFPWEPQDVSNANFRVKAFLVCGSSETIHYLDSIQAKVYYMEADCTSGEEICIEKEYYDCENGFWVNKGMIIGKCSVECFIHSDCGKKNCSVKDQYFIEGDNSATGTSYCKFRDYEDCQRTCFFPSCYDCSCDTYSDIIKNTAGVCQYIEGCSGSIAGVAKNYPKGTPCGEGKDCDGNGNCKDIEKLEGDVNGDCNINIFDLAADGICFGREPIDECEKADIYPTDKPDGQINIFDLATIGINFGRAC